MRENRGRTSLWLSLVFVVLMILPASVAFAAQIRRVAEPVPDRYIVTVEPGTDVDAAATALASQYGGRVLAVWKHALKGFWIEIAGENATRLAADARVKSIEQDAVLHSSAEGETRTGQTGVPPEIPNLITCPPGTAPPVPDKLWHLTRISHRYSHPPCVAPNYINETEAEYFSYRYPYDGALANERVKVYLIDTGVWTNHPEFSGATVSFGTNAAAIPDYKGGGRIALPAPLAVDHSNSPRPCNGALPGLTDAAHGTMTASMVVGRNVGVAKGVNLVSVNTMSCADVAGKLVVGSSAAVLISGLDWVLANGSRPAVISISTFREVCSPYNPRCQVAGNDVTELEKAFYALIDAGYPIFASANNQNSDACRGTPPRLSMRGGRRPGLPGVITVGGIDRDDKRWATAIGTSAGSNFGQCVDIFAPAATIPIAYPGSEENPAPSYGIAALQSGTSFSAPIVAAMAARMMAEDPTYFDDPATTVKNVWDRLRENASPFSASNLGVASPQLLAYLGGVTFKLQPAAEIVVKTAAPYALTVEIVESAGTFSYQWYDGANQPISGATTKTLTVTPTTAKKTYWLRVKRTTAQRTYSADSRRITVSMGGCEIPEITAQPASQWTTPDDPSTTNDDKVRLSATVDATGSNVIAQWVHITEQSGTDGAEDATTHEDNVGAEQTLNEITGTVTVDVDRPDGPTTGGVLLPTYQLVLRPASTCGTSWEVRSDTAQIRVCSKPAKPTITRKTPTTFGEQLDAGAVAGQVRWYYSANNSSFTPLRLDDLTAEQKERNKGAEWATLTTAAIYPPKIGWYAVKALGECGESDLSAAVQVTSACSFRAEGSIDGDAFSGAPRRFIAAGGTARLEARPTYPSTNAVEASFVVTWDDAPTAPNPRVVTVNGPTTYTANVKDVRSQCTKPVTFVVDVFPCRLTIKRHISDPALDGLADDVTFTVPSGSEYMMSVETLIDNIQNTPPPPLKYEWRDETEALLATTPTLTSKIIGEKTFELTVILGNNECIRKKQWKFKTVACALSLTGLLQDGSCGSSETSPLVVRGIANKVAKLTALVADGSGTPLPATLDPSNPSTFVLDQLTYDWQVGGVSKKKGRGVLFSEYYQPIPSTPVDVVLIVTSTSKDCLGATFTFNVGARAGTTDAPQCTGDPSQCPQHTCSGKRRSVRVFSTPTKVKPFTPGEVAELEAPDETLPSTYAWYRRVGTSETKIGTTAAITVTFDIAAEYYVITTNANGEQISDYLIAVPAGGTSASLTVMPLVRTITADQPASFTATLAGADPATTQYEWRSGTDYTRLSAPIIGRNATLTVRPYDNDVYWCRAIQNAGTPNQVAHNSPFVTVFVNCTTNVSGIASARPQKLRRGERPLLLPAATGKLLTYTWSVSTPQNPTPVVFSTQQNPKPAATEAQTTFSAEAVDSCGTKGVMTPVTVYLCVPTVATQPVGTLQKSPTYSDAVAPTLTVAATPAIDGQALTVKWYRSVDLQMTTPLATGATFAPTVAAGSSDSFYATITSTCGSSPHVVRSEDATVEVCAEPQISTPVLTKQGYAGIPESLVVLGDAQYSYQWYLGDSGNTSTPLAGETSATLFRGPTVTTRYWCQVTNRGLCKKSSPTFTIEICSAPVITTQPVSKGAFIGKSVTLTVAATSSTHPVTYQWQVMSSTGEWIDVAGQTGTSFVTPPFADTAYYRVAARAAHCETMSNEVTVYRCSYGETVGGGDVKVAYNARPSLSLPPMSPVKTKSITWYRGDVLDRSTPVATGTGTNLSYTTPAITQQTLYWAEFVDEGCVSRTNVYTVRPCKPTITANPQSVAVSSGTQATLSVTATGTPLTYQWYLGNSGDTSQPVSGATSSTYAFTPPATANYWVRVTGCSTNADSAAATVTVCPMPAITSLTKTSGHAIGGSGTITVSATGANLTYQWYKGQSGDTTRPIAGATSAAYTFTLQTSEYYWVRVGTTCNSGAVNSTAIMYGVDAKITDYPDDVTIPRGTSTKLTVVAEGTYLTYQWFLSTGVKIDGATSATYTTPNLTADTGYFVRVGSGNLAGSNNAVIHVTVCNGPQVGGLDQSISGSTYTFTVSISIYDKDESRYFWYRGTPGDPSNSTLIGEYGMTKSFTTPGTYWVRVYWTDMSCWDDTTSRTIP